MEQTGKLQTIEMYDENVMGQIHYAKPDANTDQGLKDAEFTITASEDIVTPDGTVQVKKGKLQTRSPQVRMELQSVKSCF